MKIKEALRKMGEKSANMPIEPFSYPRMFFEPKPPARIQAAIDKANKEK